MHALNRYSGAASPRDAEWLVRVWRECAGEARRLGSKFVLVLDEIQKIPRWSEIVKGLWDADRERDAPMRAEVPSVQRTVQLAADSKHDWLAYPVLAGLSIRESEGSLDVTPLSDDFKRSALAIHATAPLMPSQYPKWPERWLNEDPELVLETLRRCALAAMGKGDTSLSMLNWLNGVDGFEDKLHDFRLGLLRSIPVRLPTAQLPVLDELLLLASKHPDTAPLKELVSQKLRAKSMTDAQRIRWMTLDAIVSDGDALRSLDNFIGTNEKRARQLAELLSTETPHSDGFADRLLGGEPCTTLRTLVGICGRNFRPHQWKSNEAVWIGHLKQCRISSNSGSPISVDNRQKRRATP